jgi:hypothetical protein
LDQRWHDGLLEDVVVSVQNVAVFCDRTDTTPPAPLQGGWLQRFVERRRGRRHRFPPPCPDAEARAIAYDASVSAEASLNSLRHMLACAQGEAPRIFGRPVYPTPTTGPAWTNWISTWKRDRDRAQHAVTPDRQRQTTNGHSTPLMLNGPRLSKPRSRPRYRKLLA